MFEMLLKSSIKVNKLFDVTSHKFIIIMDIFVILIK